MGSRMVFRRSNGQFRRTPSLEEMGLPIAKTPRTCNACGETWHPLVTYGTCPKCGSEDNSRPASEEATP